MTTQPDAASAEEPGQPNPIERILAWADRTQQRFAVFGLPYAVVKKFGDDQAGNLAALVAYYSFFGIFPLLLTLITVLGLVLQGNPELQADILDSALANIPVIGTQLRDGLGTLPGSGWALAVGIIGTFFGARGMAASMQNASNVVWAIPRTQRPGFPFDILRSLGLTLSVGIGLAASTFLSSLVTSTLDLGGLTRVVGLLVTALLNVGVFWLSFRISTAPSVRTRDLAWPAVAAALAWMVLQIVGTLLVTRNLANASDVYGTFAVVIGLLTYLALAATTTLFALELGTVLERDLWPRALTPALRTAADERALRSYAVAEQRDPATSIEVTFAEPGTTAETDPASPSPDAPATPASADPPTPTTQRP